MSRGAYSSLLRSTGLLVALCANLGACKTFETVGDAYALGFNESSSCASAAVTWDYVGTDFTIEAWVQSNADQDYTIHPIAVWPGSFALWTDAEGVGYFTTTDVDAEGVSYPQGWMDGDLHHIAGTYTEGFTTLYVDGEQVGFNTNVVLGTEPGEELKIGCWGGKDAFDGLIDEIRLSAGLRYEESFEPELIPFEGDETTVHLWHANEGTDNVALDAMARSDLVLEAVDWVAFDLAGDEDAAE